MDFIKEVLKLLKITGLPVAFLSRPQKFPGVSYRFFDEKVTLWGDGKPVRGEAKCQIELWTNAGAGATHLKAVANAMNAGGWRRIHTDEEALLDGASGMYSRIMIFRKTHDMEEG